MSNIYLAGPYTSDDPKVMQERFEAVSRAAASMILEGLVVYSPVTHGGTLGNFVELPPDFDYWSAHCLSFVERWADELHVLCLLGWEESRGVKAEIKAAEALQIPVIYRLVN